jgi:hypothetical protein
MPNAAEEQGEMKSKQNFQPCYLLLLTVFFDTLLDTWLTLSHGRIGSSNLLLTLVDDFFDRPPLDRDRRCEEE